MKATLHTTLGDIAVTLFPNEAPTTVANFVGLAQGTRQYRDDTGRTNPTPFFDGLVFHRVIPGFMIQGGCPRGDGRGGPGYTFDDEPHPDKTYAKPYLLAMANAGKHQGRGTNGSQFFITVSTPMHLQGKHTIFGEVADAPSRAVVDAIAAVPTARGDRPLQDVVITSVTVQD
ncbi:MAG: peptidylprolyl isomerase [Dermatophilaceae bacterium]